MAIPIFTKEGVILTVGTSGGARNLGIVTDINRQDIYWYQERPQNNR